MPFEKGNQLAKGHGRPKGALSLNDSIRKILAKKDIATKRKELDNIAEIIVQQAKLGNKDFNPTMMIQLWQQIDGKPKESLDINAETDNTIRFVVEGVDVSKFPKQ